MAEIGWERRQSVSLDAMRYILSAGRTGTVYISHLINENVEGVQAVHEPDTSRYQMILANLRNEWGIGGRLLRRIFEASRELRERAAPGLYVEINPFLCPMTDLIPKAGRPLRIAHIVREPASWAVSISTFKASTRYRGLIDSVPFAKPYPAPRPAGWTDLDEYGRALWRWRWCNSRIGALKPFAQAYDVIRFEDLTSSHRDIREAALSMLSRTLALPGDLRETVGSDRLPTNPSPGGATAPDRETAARICGDLARAYGYEY